MPCFGLLSAQEVPDTNSIENSGDTTVSSQAEEDTVKVHSVKKAAIFSAVLPGLGQAYNRKYWKMPIVYGALGGLGYLVVSNHLKHKAHVNEYIARQEDSNYVSPEEFSNLDDQALITIHRQFQNKRDLMFIACIGVYVLNIVDAAVDAHFFYFDIGDDLSLNWMPQFSPSYTGLSLQLHLNYGNQSSFHRKPRFNP